MRSRRSPACLIFYYRSTFDFEMMILAAMPRVRSKGRRTENRKVGFSKQRGEVKIKRRQETKDINSPAAPFFIF